MAELNALLLRQLRRFQGEIDRPPADWPAFLAAVGDAYDSAEADRSIVERSLELSSTELFHANADMRDVFLACPDTFLWIDEEANIESTNVTPSDSLYQVLTDSIGKPLPELPYTSLASTLTKAWTEVRRTESSIALECEQTVERQNRCFEVRLLLLSRGKTIAIIRDITQRANAEALLAEHNETLEIKVQQRTADLLTAKMEAESASRAKSEFLANMSHELRTPLHGILSFAGFGGRRAETASQEQIVNFFQRIEKSGQVLLSLLNNLLDLAKLESGKMTARLERIDLRPVLASIVDEFRAILESQNITIDCRLPEQPITGDVDGGLLKQVLRNLVANATEVSAPGDSIELLIEVGPDHVVVLVRDHGMGIPEQETESIFDKFAQSSRTRSGAGGTGLGLAICRDILNLHSGRIWAENDPQGGAIFYVELPIPDASGAATAGSLAVSRSTRDKSSAM